MKENKKILIKKTSECTQKEINDFYQLVLRGGEDDPRGLKGNIERAELLGFCYINNYTLVGIAALKNPRSTYKARVFRNAGLFKEASNYDYEIGYAYTCKMFRRRGICHDLIIELIEKASSNRICASTRASNVGMQRINEGVGFKKVGKPYRGRAEYIQLYVLKRN